MIDASRSPRPLWKRILVGALLVGSIAAAAGVIWVKELHHPAPHVHTLLHAAIASGVLRNVGAPVLGVHTF